ncbi:hypothetical protein Tco_0764516 [Tanacetum coccineum]
MEVFMKDFSIFGNSFDNCLHNLDKMLQHCKDANLVLNWEKCHFMVKERIVLGHKVSGAELNMISSISIRSSNVQPSESPYLHVLFIEMSEIRQQDKSESQSVVSLSYSSTNKAFQVPEDSLCLKPFLYGKHELLASVNIIPCPKPCIQTRIHPVDLEFLDPVVQCLINLLQSAVTKLVDLIEPHDHLNPIFFPKCDGP